MNNSDFYKLKYLKYKNKYKSLKNKNELELKGGVSYLEGRFLFYIPEIVLQNNNIYFRGMRSPQTEMYINHQLRDDLTFEHLYNMSVLVIPVSSDGKTISSTKEWFIPQKTEKFNPKKWDKEKHIKGIDENKWLYYIAKQFLDDNPTLKLPNLDNLAVSCVEYEINKLFSNKLISRTSLSSFNYFKREVQKNQKILNDNGKTFQDLQTAEKKVWEQIKLLQSQIKLAQEDSNEALKKNREGTEQEKSAAMTKYKNLQKEIETKDKEIESLKKYAIDIREANTFLSKTLQILNDNKELLQWTQQVV